METITYLVQGSEPQPYQVVFSYEGQKFIANCSCKAGIMGQYCKHRIDILRGDDSSIVSTNKNTIPELLKFFVGTPLDTLLQEIEEKEVELDEAKKHISNLKKKFARIMSGN